MLESIKQDVERLKNPEKARVLSGFFKTGKGEYGEGDKFLGIVVPEQRKLAQQYIDISFCDLQKLLNSKIHEHRLTALLILTYKYKKCSELDSEHSEHKRKIFDFYLKNTRNINNWDLVDVTTPHIVGAYLLDKDRSVLYKLAR